MKVEFIEIDKKLLFKEVNDALETNNVSEKLGQIWLDMAKNIRSKYFHYIDNDLALEVECEAVLMCMENYKKYDPERSKNAYSFFFKVIYNGIKRGFRKTKYLVKNPNAVFIDIEKFDIKGKKEAHF